MKNEIPVVFATNNAFVPYTAVALQSLIDCANKELLYSVYVLHTGLYDNNKKRLISLSTENVVVRCMDVSKEMQDIVIETMLHFTPECTYRILIPELLPHYDKVLYLDSDIVVLRDVAELYNTNLKKHVVGAVMAGVENDPIMVQYLDLLDLGVPPDLYFYSGVLLINTEMFKNMRIRDKCFNLLHKETKFTFPDQDALNRFCVGNVLHLDIRWNYNWELPNDSPHINIPSDELKIIHFAGSIKPWHVPEKMYANFFWEQARKSSFYEEIIFKGIDARTRWAIDQITNA